MFKFFDSGKWQAAVAVSGNLLRFPLKQSLKSLLKCWKKSLVPVKYLSVMLQRIQFMETIPASEML